MNLDQFLFQLPPELRRMVRDLVPKTVKEAAEIADQLAINRGSGTAGSYKDYRPKSVSYTHLTLPTTDVV